MKPKVHTDHDVKNALDHRVETSRSPTHRNGPMDAARLAQPRMTIARRCTPGVAREYTTTALAPML